MHATSLTPHVNKSVELALVRGQATGSIHGTLCHDEDRDEWAIRTPHRVVSQTIGANPASGELIEQHAVLPSMLVVFEPEDVLHLAVELETLSEAEEALGVKNGSKSASPVQRSQIKTSGLFGKS